MTALGGNIHPLRVAGTFDDCQRLVKELFADAEFRKRRRVTSANSINLLRWIPQAFYYFYGYCQWRQAAGGDRPGCRRAERQLRQFGRGDAGAAHGTAWSGVSWRRRMSTTWFPNSSARAFTARRPVGEDPAMRWMSAPRAISERMLWLCGGDPEVLRGELEGFRCDDACIRRHDRRAVRAARLFLRSPQRP